MDALELLIDLVGALDYADDAGGLVVFYTYDPDCNCIGCLSVNGVKVAQHNARNYLASLDTLPAPLRDAAAEIDQAIEKELQVKDDLRSQEAPT